jgi:hypothetical protein
MEHLSKEAVLHLHRQQNPINFKDIFLLKILTYLLDFTVGLGIINKEERSLKDKLDFKYLMVYHIQIILSMVANHKQETKRMVELKMILIRD